LNKTFSLGGYEFTVSTLLKAAFLTAVFLGVFWPLYPSLLERFFARDSYYSHGVLVPFVSLYLVFRKRKVLETLVPQPSLGGIFVVAAGIFLQLIGQLLKVNFISYVSLLVSLYGIVIALGGKHFLKEFLFPIGFLVFMLPLPSVLIIGISFKLKMVAAQCATALVKLFGIAATQAGSTIYYPGGFLVVGDPCSGLRSLIAFLALGALVTQFVRVPGWKKVLLFFFAVPIALFTNFLRLTFLVVVGYFYGEGAATGFIHDASGIVVFILGFFCFIGLIKLFRYTIEI
jgi:exosortase